MITDIIEAEQRIAQAKEDEKAAAAALRKKLISRMLDQVADLIVPEFNAARYILKTKGVHQVFSRILRGDTHLLLVWSRSDDYGVIAETEDQFTARIRKNSAAYCEPVVGVDKLREGVGTKHARPPSPYIFGRYVYSVFCPGIWEGGPSPCNNVYSFVTLDPVEAATEFARQVAPHIVGQAK